MIARVTARLFVWGLLLACVLLIAGHVLVAGAALIVASAAGGLYLCTFESPDEIARRRR